MVKQCFERLKCNVNVMREIALRRPNAHLAFLRHAPYRKLYNNDGQMAELHNAYGAYFIHDAEGECKVIYANKYNRFVAINDHVHPHFFAYIGMIRSVIHVYAQVDMGEKCKNCYKYHPAFIGNIARVEIINDKIKNSAVEKVHIQAYTHAKQNAIKLYS